MKSTRSLARRSTVFSGLTTLSLLGSACSTGPATFAADLSSLLPREMVLQTSSVEAKTFEAGENGALDKDATKKFLEAGGAWPSLVAWSNGDGHWAVYSGTKTSLPDITYLATPENDTELTGRLFYSLDTDFGVSSILAARTSAQFSHVLELEMTRQKNNQWRLSYQVNPATLFAWDREGALVLFASHIYAPELLMIHELSSVSVDASVPIVFNAKAGIFRERKRILSNQFVLRSYADPAAVAALTAVGPSGKREAMFEEAPESDTASDGQHVSPKMLRYAWRGKVYRCTPAYALHLGNEGVEFDCSTAGFSGTVLQRGHIVTTQGLLK